MGIANIINNSTTTSGGEIVRELVNSSDGAGLHFDGTNGFIDIASPPDLGAKFSFEFIFKASTWTSGNIKILFDFEGSGDNRFMLRTNASGNNLRIYDGTTDVDTGVVIFDDLAVHHIVVTVDGTAAVVYDNGNQVATATISASHGLDNATDARIGSDVAGRRPNGTFYRARFYNKALTSAEVQTAYERADVDFADQYGSQTIAGTFANTTSASAAFGTLTGVSATGFTGPYNNSNATNRAGAAITGGFEIGKKYRISFDYALNGATGAALWASSGPALSGVELISALSGTSFSTIYTPTVTSAYLQFYIGGVPASGNFVVSNFKCDKIGCVSDYDLAFANPTQSRMVQDRAGAADGTCSASGVTQVQKVVQLNATAARIGTTAATPADGDIIVSGNVGVGTGASAPLSKLNVKGTQGNWRIDPDSVSTEIQALASNTANSGFIDYRLRANQVILDAGGSPRLTIDSAGLCTFNNGITVSGGNLLLGKTSAGVTTLGVEARQNGILAASRDGATALYVERKTSDGSCVELIRGGTTVGTISVTGSATAYNTSSDYRLKENLEPLTGALDRIDALPVYRFNFTTDPDTTVDGFIAHEVSEHVPEAITGEKDAMKTVVVQEAVEAVEAQPATYWQEGDELPEGVAVGDEKTPAVEAVEAVEEVTEEQPDYQGIDQSKLVPLLVAAVKELKAKVETLENA